MLLIQFELQILDIFPFDKYSSVHPNYVHKEVTVFGDPLFCHPQMKQSRTKATATREGNTETSNLIS